MSYGNTGHSELLKFYWKKILGQSDFTDVHVLNDNEFNFLHMIVSNDDFISCESTLPSGNTSGLHSYIRHQAFT